MVGVVAHQRRHVERGREAGLPVIAQVAEPLVRLLGGAEAGELPHRPELPAVHGRVDPAREREDSGKTEVAFLVDLDRFRRVQRVDVEARDGGEELALALGGGLVQGTAPLG